MADSCNGSMNEASVLCLGGISEQLVTLAQVACSCRSPTENDGFTYQVPAMEINFT